MKKDGRTRLEKLQRSWTKASGEERRQFLEWIGHRSSGEAPATAADPIASGRYLTPRTISRVRIALAQRSMTLADLSTELGLRPGDLSLARAFARNASLRLRLIEALQQWLEDHATDGI
ncbi:hypothetical protein J5J10_16295 [Ciceribacter sp. L1K23]|uniref:hypothetical protein n=1 Tax=Ciceribacter sp. L1K23 TaxID=2820276 RepID=UPI001B816CC2|nr:hypothetical protein [Ciceribacter sp. L1K23]MBR0557249.1 hypothetical protein [Ciceribacter sp. L1K23]